jgi:Fe2+ transport system protein FeoA
MRCPICNYEFEVTAMSSHVSCAFNASCAIICCPNCGYQIPDERKSRLAEAFRRFLARRRGEEENLSSVRALSAMQAGQSGKVIAIHSQNHARIERLNVLGLIPDAQVKLEQKRPTYVLRVGFTELTIEREIADEILVEVIG